MPQIFIGNAGGADAGMLDALKQLPDHYFVFVEFQIPAPGNRQADFLVIRPERDSTTLTLIEVKNESRLLQGTINGPWEVAENGPESRTLMMSNRDDRNPLQQARNTAIAMQKWMISMQSLLQDPANAWPDPYRLTVFPRLMLAHANPANRLQTDTFCWRWDTYEQAIANLKQFKSRDPFLLTEGEIQNMVRELGLQRLEGEVELPPAVAPSAPNQLLDRILNELQDIQDNLRILSSKVDVLMAQAEGDLELAEEAAGEAAAERAAPSPPVSDAHLERLFALAEQAARNLTQAGARMVFPNVHSELSRLAGEKINPADYGFFNFKALMEAAERRHFVKLARVGTVDYAYPPDYEGVLPQPAPHLEALAPDELANFIRLLDQLESSRPYVTVSYAADYLERVGFLGLKINDQTRLIREGLRDDILSNSSYSLENRLTGMSVPIRTITLNTRNPEVVNALRGQTG